MCGWMLWQDIGTAVDGGFLGVSASAWSGVQSLATIIALFIAIGVPVYQRQKDEQKSQREHARSQKAVALKALMGFTDVAQQLSYFSLVTRVGLYESTEQIRQDLIVRFPAELHSMLQNSSELSFASPSVLDALYNMKSLNTGLEQLLTVNGIESFRRTPGQLSAHADKVKDSLGGQVDRAIEECKRIAGV